MHTKTEHRFDTEDKAKHFAEVERFSALPHEDKYVRGPFFVDEDILFRDMIWASTHEKYWVVAIETYS